MSERRVSSNLGEDGVIPWRSPTVVGIVASAVVTPMAVPLISPALPAMRAALGITDAQAGLLITVYALPGIVLAPVAGMLADRVGRRAVLAVCLVGYGIFGSLIALTSEFTLILALRFLQGCTAGSIIVSLAMTLVGDHFEGPARNAVMGATTAGLSLGVAVYPAIGGYLSAFRWNLPFAMYAFSAVVGGFVYLTMVEPDIDRGSRTLSYPREVYRAVPTREAVALYGIILTKEVLLFGGVFTALPFFLNDAFALNSTEIGVLTSVALLVTAVVATQNGRLAGRFSNRGLVAAGFGAYALGLVGAGSAPTPLLVLAAFVVFGIGHGIASPALFTALSDLVSGRFRGGVMSIRTSMTAAGQAIGPVVFTALAPVLGYGRVLVVAGGVAALGSIAIAALLGRGAPDSNAKD